MTKPKILGGLGSRDIELFNLSLLARQAWRVLQDPGSLSARLLKAVYFPEVDFLDAGVGSAPSRTWRAIVEGKDVLKLGLIRRIGTGEETDIWSMKWLPRDRMFRPLRSTCANPPRRVSKLIDTISTLGTGPQL
jgi:hypothetical protein